MSLVQAVLKGIKDDRQIAAHLVVGTPLWTLIETYNKVAMNDDNLPAIMSSTTGGEMKVAIGLMQPDVQVAILHKYCQSTKTLDVHPVVPVVIPATNDETLRVEERKFKLYIAKLFMTGLMILMFVVVGAVIAISVKNGELANEGLISTIMTTAGEIIKLIFSSK